LTKDEKKTIACCHMLVVYVLLRWLKHKSLRSHNTLLPSLFAFIPNLLWYYIPALLLEEFIYFALLRHFLHIRNSICFTIRGRPSPEGTADEDCCVCYGVGVGTGATTFYPDQDEEEDDDLGILENYCVIPHHVAHRPCMFRWYTMGMSELTRTLAWQNLNLRLSQYRLINPTPTCPSCRGKLIVEILQEGLLEKEDTMKAGLGKTNKWLGKLERLIREWRTIMSWKWVIARGEITIIYILIIWRVLKWREKIMTILPRL
ncbi:11409_t:CDS:2, partial [Acaulospora morrowiae]